MKIYKFRNCILDTLERRVVKNGRHVELTPRTFDVLQMLVERSGEIVTKDEMLGKIWDGSFVEESNLPVHISKLRRLLASPESDRFIETVHGVGYRFVCTVSVVIEEDWFDAGSTNGSATLSGSFRKRRNRDFILTGKIGSPPNEMLIRVEMTEAGGGGLQKRDFRKIIFHFSSSNGLFRVLGSLQPFAEVLLYHVLNGTDRMDWGMGLRCVFESLVNSRGHYRQWYPLLFPLGDQGIIRRFEDFYMWA